MRIWPWGAYGKVAFVLFSSRALKEGEGCDDRQSKEPTDGVFVQSRTRIAASQ